jgi:hypothetical protein
MRHLQLYESFGTKDVSVTIYTDIDQWMEKLKMNLSRNEYIWQSGTNLDFWKDIFSLRASIYTAKRDPNTSGGTWFFWDDPRYREIEIRLIRYGYIEAGYDTIQSGVQSDSLHVIEEDLGYSYQDLIKQAKPPGEVMIQNILENPDMLEYYSEEAPLTLEKGIALSSEEIKMKLKALSKWKQIKDFI